MRKALVLLLLLTGPAEGACSRTPNQIPAGVSTYYYGHLTSGHVFGIEIAEQQKDAQRRLSLKHIFYVSKVSCDYYLSSLLNCKSGDFYSVYSIREPLRWGNLYVRYSGGVVAEIAWETYLVPHIDT